MRAGILKTVGIVLILSVSTAFGAGSAAQEHGNILIKLFLGFGALVLLVQTSPALISFSSMLTGLFSSHKSEPTFSSPDVTRQPKH